MPAIMTHGIPMRFWNHREDREETVYLSTRRSGKTGQELLGLRHQYNACDARLRRIGRDMRLVSVAVRDDMPIENLREAADQQDNLQEQLLGVESSLDAIAQQIVRAALADCHGADEAVRILDCLSDRQIHQAVRMMEIGEEPKDFFDGRGTRPSAPGTGPAGAGSGGCSSRPATAAATSATPIS